MFEIEIDTRRAMLRIALHGYWQGEQMSRFETALPDALARLARLPGPTLCLIDASDFPVQGQEIADRHARLLAAVEPRMADHVAVLIPGALARSQARRISHTPRRQLFEDRAEALAWLAARAAGASAAA